MAFSLLPFDRLSVKQLHIVAAQRRRNGFHAYYTGGFDATRKQFGFITPGYLLRGCSITTVFLYPSPGATAGGSKTMYATNLGQYSKHLRYLVSLTFKGDTDAYVEYWYANVKQSGYDLSSRDLKGFHVVQYEVNENGLQVPAYYNSSKEFYFDHDNVDISAGGYALWNGTWSPGQDVIVSGEGLAGKLYVPETGKLVALVKVYRSSATFFSDADNPSKPPTVLASNNSFGLSSLRIQPSPHNLVEFKAVTGEITY
ncbi:uncharacterized protein [Dermacentor albipictus]|uniref:uncharacterized protein isoform X2 n=1 Tax=Dermacentor albipictus TaxID=60249 RepID=UPI0038FC6591